MDNRDTWILTQPHDGRGRRVTKPGHSGWYALVSTGFVCFAIAACAPRRAEAPPPGPAPTTPRAAVPAGAREYQVDPEASVVTLLVRRAGTLSGFGHVHVVTSAEETGRVWFGSTPDLSGFEIRVPVEAFVVDDPAARATAGPEFAAKVPEDARSGTRRNMLGPDVLDSARYPEIIVSSAGPLAATPPAKLRIRMVVRAGELEREIPVTARIEPDSVAARGCFTVLQSELGIKPISIMGGAVAVADEIEVRFDIVAKAIGGAG